MNQPLLDGPMSVANTIQKFASHHMGRSPTQSEFRDICLASGNTNEEIDNYVKDAIDVGIVSYDKGTDILVISNWKEKQ